MNCPQIFFTTGPAQEGIEMIEVGSIENFPVFLIGKSDKKPEIVQQAQTSVESPTRRFYQNV